MTTLAKLCQRYITDKSYWLPNVYAANSVELINFVRVEILQAALRNKVFVLIASKKTHHQVDDMVRAIIDDGFTPVFVGEEGDDVKVAMLATDNLAVLEPTTPAQFKMLEQLGLKDLEHKTIDINGFPVRILKDYKGDVKSMKQTLFAQYHWHEIHTK